jgi:hypothetical protein
MLTKEEFARGIQIIIAAAGDREISLADSSMELYYEKLKYMSKGMYFLVVDKIIDTDMLYNFPSIAKFKKIEQQIKEEKAKKWLFTVSLLQSAFGEKAFEKGRELGILKIDKEDWTKLLKGEEIEPLSLPKKSDMALLESKNKQRG